MLLLQNGFIVVLNCMPIMANYCMLSEI